MNCPKRTNCQSQEEEILIAWFVSSCHLDLILTGFAFKLGDRGGKFLLRRNGIFFAFSGESIKCFFLGREIFLLLDSNAFKCVRNQYICIYLLFFSVQLKHWLARAVSPGLKIQSPGLKIQSPGLKIQLFLLLFLFSLLKKKVQKTPKVTFKGGTKIEGRGGRKNVLKRTRGQLKRMYYSTQSI